MPTSASTGWTWTAGASCWRPIRALPCSSRCRWPPAPGRWSAASTVDYRQDTGTYYVQDVYAGPGLAGVPRGTIKKLRVVALEFRAAGIGNNGSGGPGGGALISTPIAIGNGTWDVKMVLGDATVYEDGSAFFTVPARTPVYFQALDEQGRAVQTMRSWSTLQPGENAACVGCHEHKNTAPPAGDYGFTLAHESGRRRRWSRSTARRAASASRRRSSRSWTATASAATRTGSPSRRSSQHQGQPPLLDAQAARSGRLRRRHEGRTRFQPAGRGDRGPHGQAQMERRLPHPDAGSRQANPMALFAGNCQGRVVNWIGSQSVPEPLPPYSAGAARSELLALLESGHKGVKLSREELDKIACWIDLLVPYCGDYLEANAWTEAEMKKHERYAEKRREMEEKEQQSIDAMLGHKDPARGPGPGMPMGPRRY